MILLVITLVQIGLGWVVLGRLGHRRSPGPRAELIAPRLSIILPVRNEEHNLPRLLDSLAAQEIRAREIIVVDDGSTDRTAHLARARGATVVTSAPLPEGWRGKTWACHQGAQQASGDYFLFVDADTWFEPGGLLQALALFPAAGSGALSVAPHHRVERFYEQFSAFFNLVMLAGTGAFAGIRGWAEHPRLLGQFLLIDRATYRQIGGHETVKGRILENFWLSQRLQALGIATAGANGRGIFSIRMYPHGWQELVDGWAKGFASGAGQTPLPLLLLIILWLGGLFFVPIGVTTQACPCYWAAVYGVCTLQVGRFLRAAGTFHWLTALAYPVFILAFFGVFGLSLMRSGQNVHWKGRAIRAD